MYVYDIHPNMKNTGQPPHNKSVTYSSSHSFYLSALYSKLYPPIPWLQNESACIRNDTGTKVKFLIAGTYKE